MMKRAVIINGVAAEISMLHFLPEFLENKDYEVRLINILDEKYRLRKLRIGFRPDLIIGFSLGGMVAMKVARRYPRAKLLLVATGVRLDPENIWFKLLFRVVKIKGMLRRMQKMIFVPRKLLIPIYEKVNPIPLIDKAVQAQYRQDMSDNIDFFRKVGLTKWLEILRFCRRIDLAKIASRLRNETLIFSGEKDGIMAVGMGKEMKQLIKNSQLVVTEGGHFNAITKDDLKVIGEFVNG